MMDDLAIPEFDIAYLPPMNKVVVTPDDLRVYLDSVRTCRHTRSGLSTCRCGEVFVGCPDCGRHTCYRCSKEAGSSSEATSIAAVEPTRPNLLGHTDTDGVWIHHGCHTAQFETLAARDTQQE